MNKDAVKQILERTLRAGGMMPSIFQMPKAMMLKSELEACTEVKQVVHILQGETAFLSKAFGVSKEEVQLAIVEIQKGENHV